MARFPASAPIAPEKSLADGPSPSQVINFSPITKLWLAIVILLVFWQPLQLGFYLDDWTTAAEAVKHGDAFSEQRFHFILGIDPSRPGIIIPRFILSSLLGDRPLLWQIAMLLANVGVVASTVVAVQSIRRIPCEGAVVAFAASWLILPWSTSNQFWTVLLPVELLLALFALLLASTVRQRPTILIALAQGAVYFWLCTSYEVFYGQFLAIVLLLAGLAVLRMVEARAVLSAFVSLGVAQLLAFAWYFESPRLTKGMYLDLPNWVAGQRPIEHGWMKLAIANLLQFVPNIVLSMTEILWPVCLVFLALLAASGALVWKLRRKWASPQAVLGVALIAAACVFGAGLSVLCYSFGGRALAGTGVDNRSFVLISFWSLLLATLAASAMVALADARWRKRLSVLSLACGVLLGCAHTVRAVDWSTAWTLQNQILESAPVADLNAADRAAAVILVNPLTVRGAPVFSADWDINSALPLTHPLLEGRHITLYNRWLGPMTWDGDTLTYPLQRPVMKTKEVYLWIPMRRSFQRAPRPFEIRQDLSVHELP